MPDSPRLHPRLRVLKNGDRVVNAVRSDATTTVACALTAFSREEGVPAAPAIAASAPDVDALRDLIAAPSKWKLPRRARIQDRPSADES